jgi:hypothetical protein
MKSNLIKTLVVVPLLALSSMAFAAEPVQLSAAEMDGVTAGGISGGLALASAVGWYAATATSAFGSAAVIASWTSEVTTINAVLTLSGASSASSSH